MVSHQPRTSSVNTGSTTRDLKGHRQTRRKEKDKEKDEDNLFQPCPVPGVPRFQRGQQRPLGDSMLAYTERMREISQFRKDSALMADVHASSSSSPSSEGRRLFFHRAGQASPRKGGNGNTHKRRGKLRRPVSLDELVGRPGKADDTFSFTSSLSTRRDRRFSVPSSLASLPLSSRSISGDGIDNDSSHYHHHYHHHHHHDNDDHHHNDHHHHHNDHHHHDDVDKEKRVRISFVSAADLVDLVNFSLGSKASREESLSLARAEATLKILTDSSFFHPLPAPSKTGRQHPENPHLPAPALKSGRQYEENCPLPASDLQTGRQCEESYPPPASVSQTGRQPAEKEGEAETPGAVSLVVQGVSSPRDSHQSEDCDEVRGVRTLKDSDAPRRRRVGVVSRYEGRHEIVHGKDRNSYEGRYESDDGSVHDSDESIITKDRDKRPSPGPRDPAPDLALDMRVMLSQPQKLRFRPKRAKRMSLHKSPLSAIPEDDRHRQSEITATAAARSRAGASSTHAGVVGMPTPSSLAAIRGTFERKKKTHSRALVLDTYKDSPHKTPRAPTPPPPRSHSPTPRKYLKDEPHGHHSGDPLSWRKSHQPRVTSVLPEMTSHTRHTGREDEVRTSCKESALDTGRHKGTSMKGARGQLEVSTSRVKAQRKFRKLIFLRDLPEPLYNHRHS